MDHPQKYNLGECEFHLAFRVDDYEAAYQKHKKMGCICYGNESMGGPILSLTRMATGSK